MVSKAKSSFVQDEQSKFVDKKMSNVKSDLIEITHDKLENILLKYLKNVEIVRSWITPFSIFITILVARLTTTFNDTFSISKDVWEAIFLLCMIGSFVWLLWAIFAAFACRKKSSIIYLIGLVKDSTKD